MPTFLTLFLVSAVVFVNGWTDAPNAIAGAVSTGALPYRSAVGLAAAANLLGVGAACLWNASVADTITSLVDFGAGSHTALVALCAAMVGIVLFAVGAWWFGIPTSESHALIAGLAGASLAVNPGAGLDGGSVGKVLLGLLLSLLAGFAAGGGAALLLRPLAPKMSHRFTARGQIAGAGVLAFLHGAQDGQKFAAVFVIAELLSKGAYNTGPVDLKSHLLVVCYCSALMGLGTLLGGERIIRTVGGKMVQLGDFSGFCSDLGAALCLVGATLWGIPVSTTHTKTAAVMGAGAAAGETLRLGTVGGMLTAWVITFPVCGGIGYLLTRLLLGV